MNGPKRILSRVGKPDTVQNITRHLREPVHSYGRSNSGTEISETSQSRTSRIIFAIRISRIVLAWSLGDSPKSKASFRVFEGMVGVILCARAVNVSTEKPAFRSLIFISPYQYGREESLVWSFSDTAQGAGVDFTSSLRARNC